MIAWRKQGAAVVGEAPLEDGRACTVVLVGGRENSRGAALILPAEAGGNPQTALLGTALGLLHPRTVIDILCMQERAFGNRGFPQPKNLH